MLVEKSIPKYISKHTLRFGSWEWLGVLRKGLGEYLARLGCFLNAVGLLLYVPWLVLSVRWRSWLFLKRLVVDFRSIWDGFVVNFE